MNNCHFNKETDDIIMAKLGREIEKLIKEDKHLQDEMSKRILSQDGKIAEICLYLKENLSATISEIVNTMNYTGELETLITKAVNGVLASALVAEPVYDGFGVFDVKTVRNKEMNASYTVTKIKKTMKPHVNFTNGTNENPYSNHKSVIDYMQIVDKPMAINAGLRGVTVKDGVSHIENNTEANEGFYILCITSDGELACVPRSTSATDIINMGYMDAINIWSPIIEDGTPFNPLILDLLHEDYDYIFNQKHPRQVIGVLGNGDYIVISVDGRTAGEGGVSFEQLIEICQAEGCVSAYNLDGGASTQTVIGKRLITRKLSESRTIGTVITFESEVAMYGRCNY